MFRNLSGALFVLGVILFVYLTRPGPGKDELQRFRDLRERWRTILYEIPEFAKQSREHLVRDLTIEKNELAFEMLMELAWLRRQYKLFRVGRIINRAELAALKVDARNHRLPA